MILERFLQRWTLWLAVALLILGAGPKARAEIVFRGDKQAWPVNLWRSETRESVVHSSGTFNHQPVVVVDLDGAYLAAWTGHPVSTDEGADGQRIYASRSRDGGATWSERQPLLPLDPPRPQGSGARTEWQPRLGRLRLAGSDEVWLAYTLGRGSAQQGAFLARRNQAEAPFVPQRLVYDAKAGRVRTVALEQWPGTDRSLSVLWKAEGRWWFPYPQAIGQLRDGTPFMTLTLIEPAVPFAVAEKRFAMLRGEGDAFVLSGLAPLGAMAAPDAWEADIAEAADGRLTAYLRSNDIRRPRGFRQAVSESSDGGRTWSACQWAGLAIHTEQPSIADIDGVHQVIALPDNTTHRNNQALVLVSASGLTYALGVSRETDGAVFAHTSMVALDRGRGRLLMVWSEGAVGQTARSIRFGAVDALPDRQALNLILRANARYELDDGRQTALYRNDQRRLELTGRASAGLEIPPGINELKFRLQPGSRRPGAVLATIGNYLHFAVVRVGAQASDLEVVEYRRDDQGRLQPQATSSRPLDAPASPSFSVVVDASGGQALVAGRPVTLGPRPSVFFGDGFLVGAAKPTDLLAFDLSRGAAFRCASPGATLATCAVPGR